jgi:2-polyprenyl-6-methoxyphenol hydroxylase-like FAD-dependent oxidoreductase
MPTENRETIPILIVGAGPTGLVTAIELARRNIPIRLIDVGRSSEDKLRAVGVQARTLEMFDNWGLADQFVSRGKQVIAANVFDDKRKLVRLTFSELDSRYPMY